jgi:hypothetical protein
MKTKITSLIFTLVLLLSACGGGAGASGGSELQQNREKWEGQNFDHYRFTVVVTCFCIFAGAEVTYEVQDGQVINQTVQPHPDRQIDPDEISGYYQEYNTIEKVFDFLERATNEADEVTVEYDPTYGFPTDITVDWVKEATDDEVYLTLGNFEALQ